MSGFLDAFGLIGDTVGIVGFLLDLIPPVGEEASGAVVRAGLGMVDPDGNHGPGVTTQGGTVYGIFGYDANLDFLGVSDLDIPIQAGEFADFTIHQYDAEMTEARYIWIGTDGSDDICLQYLAVSQPNGFERTVLGDTAVFCGQNHYYANVNVGEYSDGTPYSGNCIWIDGANNHGTTLGGFRANLDGFQADADAPTTFDCGAFEFSSSGEPFKKRSPKKRSENLASQLIVSRRPEQNATQLCNRPHSYGPDFIDIHGDFCDMETKRVYPVCNVHGYKKGCVHLDEEYLTVHHRGDDEIKMKKRRAFPGKGYKTINHW